MDKYTGKKLDGRYEIRQLIGVGGMANVYRCYDTIDAREVAIKIMKEEYLDNEDFIRRFKNESKAIAVLNHPNIVKVYDVSFGDMIQYIVMEYIDGITLKEYIDMQSVLEWKETVHLTTQILKALQHAHENGIVHRDIKPHNIMLLQDGTIKVTDFGIARFSANPTATKTEKAIGSVHYIAPEQARGEKTDGKTDIYSVGVMMYEMLTGKLPFDADSAVKVALMQLEADAKRPREINPSIPEGLEEITVKAMQKNPLDRYHSAVEMLSDIERFRLNPSIRFNYSYHADRAAARKQQAPRKDAAEDDYQGAPYYDEDAPVRTPALSAIKGIIVAALIALVVFGGLALYKGYLSAQPKEVDVPNFVGMSVSEASAKNTGNFVFTYESRYSDEFDVDTIIYQTPEAGSKKVKEGSTIELVVNSSDTDVIVPYINSAIGTEDIVAKIQAVNLVPKVLYVESQETAMKVDSVFPQVGSQVKIGSTVYVFVSKGITKETYEVPDVKGLSADDAVAKILEAGFTNYTIEYDDRYEAEKDEVMRQNPVQGSVVDEDYNIVITCAVGENKEKNATIYVDLPVSVTSEVRLTVLVDGVIDNDNSAVVIPAYNSTYTLKLKIKDNCSVVILLNDEQYREYSIDYESGYVTTVNAYNYYSDTPTEAPNDTNSSSSDVDDDSSYEEYE